MRKVIAKVSANAKANLRLLKLFVQFLVRVINQLS
jgi:hypothetical protein